MQLDYVPVDEAIGVLSRPSRYDSLHFTLIGLLRRGYIYAIRSVTDDPPLRYIPTASGYAYLDSHDHRHA